MNYTHQKKPYRAYAIQWKEQNVGEILDALRAQGLSAVWHAPNHIMIRDNSTIDTIQPGYWVVRGENGMIKCYDDTTFKVKYEEAT